MKISIHILLLLFLCLLISCKKDNASVDLLRQAQNIVENNPGEALALLDSIPNPENLDADSYMQYILTSVHAKYKTKQDISGDTLIFEAQKYFDGSKNAEQVALANYYAGIVNRKMNRYDRSLISFLKAGFNATKTGDNKLNGRISDYIGAVYLEQGAMDSAVIKYQKAVYYHTLEKDSFQIMRATNQVGRAYEDLSKLDSAYIYFGRALQMAQNINNEKYISNITQNLGLTSFGMGEYDKAIAYYRSALNMEATDQERVKQINIALLNIFNLINNPGSAKEYANKVQTGLPDVTDMHTKEEMYAALANYYKLSGDNKQALHFNELEAETIRQIANEEQFAKMIEAYNDFHAEQKAQFYRELQSDSNFYLSVMATILVIALLCVIFIIRHNKKENEYFQRQREEYQKFKDHIEALNKEYDCIEAEIRAMLEDTEDDNKDDINKKAIPHK